MGYCDYTDGDVIALTRQKRREASSARLKSKYGETIRIAGKTLEFTGGAASQSAREKKAIHRRAVALEREFCGTADLKYIRSIRRNLKKRDDRSRPPIRHVQKGSPHERYISVGLHKKLLEFQGGKCYLCSLPFTPEDDATQDHVVPRAHGGKHSGNILLAHAQCNNRKGSRLPTKAELDYLGAIRAKFAEIPPPPPRAKSARRLEKDREFVAAMLRAKRERLRKARWAKVVAWFKSIISRLS